MATPQQMDRDEKKRVQALRQTARSRPHLELSKASKPLTKKTLGTAFCLHLSTRQLGLTRAGVVDHIQRTIAAREKAAALFDPGIVHVKDGQPLTEQGAKMLGVEWNG